MAHPERKAPAVAAAAAVLAQAQRAAAVMVVLGPNGTQHTGPAAAEAVVGVRVQPQQPSEKAATAVYTAVEAVRVALARRPEFSEKVAMARKASS
jgi:hypothetical protein